MYNCRPMQLTLGYFLINIRSLPNYINIFKCKNVLLLQRSQKHIRTSLCRVCEDCMSNVIYGRADMIATDACAEVDILLTGITVLVCVFPNFE